MRSVSIARAMTLATSVLPTPAAPSMSSGLPRTTLRWIDSATSRSAMYPCCCRASVIWGIPPNDWGEGEMDPICGCHSSRRRAWHHAGPPGRALTPCILAYDLVPGPHATGARRDEPERVARGQPPLCRVREPFQHPLARQRGALRRPPPHGDEPVWIAAPRVAGGAPPAVGPQAPQRIDRVAGVIGAVGAPQEIRVVRPGTPPAGRLHKRKRFAHRAGLPGARRGPRRG